MPDIGWAPGDGTLIEALPCDSELTPHAKYMRPFGTCGYSHSGTARVPSARSHLPASSGTAYSDDRGRVSP